MLKSFTGNNCVRGGFQCEGYSTRSTWSKPLNSKAPIPLQSKDGFPDVADHGYKVDDNSPRQGRSSLNGREGIQTRPIVVDDDHQLHAQLTASPTSAGPRSRGSYPGQAWPNPTNPSYLSDRGQQNKEYLPSFSEIARDSNKPEYRPMPPMRDMSHPGHNTSQPPPGPPPPAQAPPPQWSSYPPAGQPDYRQAYHHPHHQAPAHPHAPHADVSNFQNTARMALNIEQQQSATRSSTNEESEKVKMIRGQAFKRSDPTLAADRLRCKAALQRFNNAGMVDQTADTTSWNILKQVLSPTPTASMAPKDKTVGSLGPGTVIDTPFDCEYGYNIKIGEDVDIGRNCTIVDVCPVIIGQKTSIGKNVSIISGGPGTDNVDRKGVNSTWQGRAITIENDVIIGEGSYIYQGVRLGARCTIEPGSVVKHDVLPDQRFGPPASGPIQLGEIGPRQGIPGR
jgi:acetyltransferase-like isoleucine patch superfamily enzyme